MLPRPAAAGAATTATTLTIHPVGRDGRPARSGFVELIRTDAPAEPIGQPLANPTTVELTPGTYLLVVEVRGDAERTYLVQPGVVVHGATKVTADARAGRPVEVSVPRADARPELLEVRYRLPVAGGDPYESSIVVSGDLVGAYFGPVWPDRPPVDGFEVLTAVTLAAPAAAYLLAWRDAGRMPAGLRRTLTAAQLATVVNRFHPRGTGTTALTFATPRLPGPLSGGFARGLPLALPGTRRDHYNVDSGGVAWQTRFDEHDADNVLVSVLLDEYTERRAARTTTATWNRAVAGPVLATPELPEHWVTRRGDTLLQAARLHGDGAGHSGQSTYREARTTLHRDGVPLAEVDAEWGMFELPPEPATYRLRVVALPVAYDTRVDVVWTFRSAHVPGDAFRPVPLRAVTFDPALRPDGTAPAGRAFRLPYTMTTQAARPVRPRVEVSHDDGGTWWPAAVTASDVVVVHPAGAGWVSLRATAEGMRQTILRAYPVRP